MKHHVKRANLFLIELVLNLFIFALCAVVCVGLLIHARGMSMDSAKLTQAVYTAQTVAEEWKATGALPEGTQSEKSEFQISTVERDGALTVTVTGSGNTTYTLEGVRRIG